MRPQRSQKLCVEKSQSPTLSLLTPRPLRAAQRCPPTAAWCISSAWVRWVSRRGNQLLAPCRTALTRPQTEPGTGRCGSVSLWRLLRQQRGARPGYVTHEAKPLLPWGPPGGNASGEAAAASARIALLSARAAAGSAPSWRLRGAELTAAADGRTLVGDVSSSYLPYAEALLAASPCTVLLMLQRDREDTLRSWRAKAGAADFWRERPAGEAAAEAALVGKNATDAARVRRAERYWAPMFPKYSHQQAPTKDDAIRHASHLFDAHVLGAAAALFIALILTHAAPVPRLYWEEYASRGAALAAAHPGRFRVFPSPAVFEDAAAQEDLLRFAGVDAPRHTPGRRYNCVASCPGAPPAGSRTSRDD